MSKQGKLLKSTTAFTRDELADFLEAIAKRIRTGSLTLGEGGEKLDFALPEVFTVEMEVEDSGRRRLKREFELEMEWEIDADGKPINGKRKDAGFTVS